MHGMLVSGLGCRNTALHVAAASKKANTRPAMVLFLIAERADASKANKKGCVTQQRARQFQLSCACLSALRRSLRLPRLATRRETALELAVANAEEPGRNIWQPTVVALITAGCGGDAGKIDQHWYVRAFPFAPRQLRTP
jgi:hypothetical protein